MCIICTLLSCASLETHSEHQSAWLWDIYIFLKANKHEYDAKSRCQWYFIYDRNSSKAEGITVWVAGKRCDFIEIPQKFVPVRCSSRERGGGRWKKGGRERRREKREGGGQRRRGGAGRDAERDREKISSHTTSLLQLAYKKVPTEGIEILETSSASKRLIAPQHSLRSLQRHSQNVQCCAYSPLDPKSGYLFKGLLLDMNKVLVSLAADWDKGEWTGVMINGI